MLDLERVKRHAGLAVSDEGWAAVGRQYVGPLTRELESTRAELAKVTAERDAAAKIERERWESARRTFGPGIGRDFDPPAVSRPCPACGG